MNRTLLVDKLKADYPNLRFITGRKHMFRPPRTIVIGPECDYDELLILHELGHALLGVFDYKTDVERLKIELGAWERARGLAAKYGVVFDEDYMQEELDTYRDWLHQKSRCPKCGLTRFQTPDSRYHCPRCDNLA